MSQDRLVVVGRIGKPFGVKGWIHVKSFTEPESNLTSFNHLQIRAQATETKVVEVQSVQFQRHNQGYIALFNDVKSREEVASYTGMEILVLRTELPQLEENEIYWVDLIGLKVHNKVGCFLGQVEEVIHNGASPILSISQGESTYLIPYVEAYIDEVSPLSHITVDWDESWTR